MLSYIRYLVRDTQVAGGQLKGVGQPQQPKGTGQPSGIPVSSHLYSASTAAACSLHRRSLCPTRVYEHTHKTMDTPGYHRNWRVIVGVSRYCRLYVAAIILPYRERYAQQQYERVHSAPRQVTNRLDSSIDALHNAWFRASTTRGDNGQHTRTTIRRSGLSLATGASLSVQKDPRLYIML